MKKTLILMSILALTLSACKTKATDATSAETVVDEVTGEVADATAEVKEEVEKMRPGKKLRTESDSLSYAMGMDYATYLTSDGQKIIGDDLNIEMLVAAIRDRLRERATISPEESRSYVQNYFSVRMPEKKKIESEKFIAETAANNPAIQRTEGGVLYEILREGNGVKATSKNDQVKVMYRGMLRNGEEFDSSYDAGRDTVTLPLNQVIPGWSEGLMQVSEGGKAKLWIPADMAYGARGAGNKIGPNEAIVFEVELFQVIPAPAEEAAATTTAPRR